MTGARKTGVWGFEVRFEGSPYFEWAAPSLLMDEDGMCIAEQVAEVRNPFDGRIMTPKQFYRLHGPEVQRREP